MKKFSRIILVLFLVNALVINFTFADTPTSTDSLDTSDAAYTQEPVEQEKIKGGAPFEVQGTSLDTEAIGEGIQDIADKGESLAYKIVQQISDKSLPVCAILILWGAVLYFILGIRNLYKKRQGLLLMWGAFTFVVIAKIMNFAFWFAFVR